MLFFVKNGMYFVLEKNGDYFERDSNVKF